ncbi:hypothetical protein EVC30_074 [Rhizobium phage RHph_Y1_11]|nr:hypothetical protein EVC30_074 [Rhizobium phage RHph_Y1_11]
MQLKITHVAGITEFEGKHPLVRWASDPQDHADRLQNTQLGTYLFLIHDPQWSDPDEEYVQDWYLQTRVAKITHPWVAFTRSPFGGFYMIEKGE